MSDVFDDTECWLGEGALWHPERQQFFWFDINVGRLLTREENRTRDWTFGEAASAAGWIDADTLLVATETRLLTLNLDTGATDDVVALEADRPETRPNDGRADPMGGFWISTMPKAERDGAPEGRFYRYYKGELRVLYEGLLIPNACCFSPDGRLGYFVDTPNGMVKRVALDADGWPAAEPEDWLDLGGQIWGADGAVTDAAGNFWNARWGGWAVACYSPEGELLREVPIDAAHVSCPAFGGPELTTLFVTTAGGRVTQEDRARSAAQGLIHTVDGVAQGKPEPRVLM